MTKKHDLFDEMLREAVCSGHNRELQRLKEEVTNAEEMPLSEDFYSRMDILLQGQKKKVHPIRYWMKFMAAAACLVLVLSGTMGMAYVLMGAESFKELFARASAERGIEASVLIDLDQLDEMAVQKTGTVYEDENINLELEGLIKGGNRVAMILKGTLKQEADILQQNGPTVYKSYGFENTEIELTGGWACTVNYYFCDEWDSLEKNQFIYYAVYTADEGFAEDTCTFEFENFGWSKEPEAAVEGQEYEWEFVPLCTGNWVFDVTLDQAQDKACDWDLAEAIDTGVDKGKITSVKLSPLACEVSLEIPYTEELVSYMDNMKIRLKDSSYLSDEYYEMGVLQTTIQSDDMEEMAQDVVSFEFTAPVDIRQIEGLEIFGTEVELEIP